MTDWAKFERETEQRLLLAAGRDHPVPQGWKPLPPCYHDWIDVTSFGQQGRSDLCAHCGEQRWRPF